MIVEDWDAVVVGTGLAGLTTTLSLAPMRTLVVTKSASVLSGSTPWAQGGMAIPRDADDIPRHIEDTLQSGAGLSDPGAVTQLIENAPAARVWLENQGVVFDKAADGSYALGQEGAHSVRRVWHVGGDASGRGLAEALLKPFLALSNVTVRTEAMVVRLLPGGALVLERARGLVLVRSPRLVFAGGGMGQLYSATTAPEGSTGDSMAIISEAGVELKDLEMIQFHPTALAPHQNSTSSQVSLLTEALRGEGARIVTSAAPGSETLIPLETDHPRGFLAPRDHLSRVVYRRRQSGHQVFLDARHLPDVETRFPTVAGLCRAAGLSLQSDLLPIVPAVHYTMGGVPVDNNGRTGLAGVWALGEAARSGVHGGNRLASNSLLECVVWGRAVAADALSAPETETPIDTDPWARGLSSWRLPPLVSALRIRRMIQAIVDDSAGPLRSGPVLEEGLERIHQVQGIWDKSLSSSLSGLTFDDARSILETRHLLLLAEPLLRQALERKSSLGAHFRTDDC